MDQYVRVANITLYKKLIAESKLDPSRDENRHEMLLTLLAEEIAKDTPDVRSRSLLWPLATQGERS
jgi:hypothetical protein